MGGYENVKCIVKVRLRGAAVGGGGVDSGII